MSYFESDPLVYAIDEDGRRCHVDAVPNGNACGCICPACNQPLVAKNAGSKLVHHFAHKKGACTWAVEAAITHTVYHILQDFGAFHIDFATYLSFDIDFDTKVNPVGTITIANLSFVEIKGRQAPLISISYKDADNSEGTFFFVVVVTHPFNDENFISLQPGETPILALNFKAIYSGLRDDYDRHFSRGDFFYKIQDPEYLKSVILNEENVDIALDAFEWIHHPVAEQAEKDAREYWAKKWKEEREEKERRREAEREARRQEEERQRQQAITAEIERERQYFESQGVETLPIIKQGVHFFADGCPLYGQANIAIDCGDFIFNKDKCIFFEGKGYYLMGCTAYQNGIGLENN